MRAEIAPVLTSDLTAAIAVDVVVFIYRAGGDGTPAERVNVLLTGEPGAWALPGALVHVDEPFEAAARRALVRKTGYDPADWYLDQLATFGAVHRDSRGRVVSVGHLALARLDDLVIVNPEAAARAWWCPLPSIPWEELRWDHPDILRTGITRLRSKLRYSWVAFELLPNPFAVSELRDLYAAFYGPKVGKLSTSNVLKAFRPLLESKQLLPVGEVARLRRRGRPPARYRFVGNPEGARDRELPW
ncbi:MAG: NUDIX domain-containing protein [Chloroflexota bacterium]|nr:NUDIX domain-containing protein [Dehalococcoidia bacterium]MDW8252972.1 NUDIX domain-containing protein [Chloroflexota bacterium]